MLIGPAIVMTETALGKTPIEPLTAGEKLCAFLSGVYKMSGATKSQHIFLSGATKSQPAARN
ncbi:hypothetical protein LTSEINV_2025 [Salmonella enterica subsp. enterica serovar Inverness str. R8-3668]|uniref:Uncharacterized protein n=1 Tax=Salmonella enterica subsp. enterica serovar Inverness str. R8-3668 TaxID=913075 RepID=G5NBW1_SALET|nr:hypothetical protein LTSEINV_2025 [Salmonella enterica subsp. enterica serovar Inverness str. R8-3668]